MHDEHHHGNDELYPLEELKAELALLQKEIKWRDYQEHEERARMLANAYAALEITRYWTEKEDKMLRKYLHLKPSEIQTYIPTRSRQAIWYRQREIKRSLKTNPT